ncbi:MAG: hypothetical protein R3C69_11145 [Geminicoccaceae bacterium]
MVAADYRADRPSTTRLEAALDGPLALNCESLQRLGDALERVPAEILEIEEIAQEPTCRFRHDHLSRCCQGLQPGRHVRRLADYRLFPGRPLADEVANDHETGGDADPNRHRLAGWRAHPRDRRRGPEPGPGGALGVVLVRRGKAEIGEHPVAHELRHMPLQPRDLAGHGVLEVPEELTHLLRIEPRRKRRRANQIDEHDCELASLGGARAGLRHVARRVRGQPATALSTVFRGPSGRPSSLRSASVRSARFSAVSSASRKADA